MDKKQLVISLRQLANNCIVKLDTGFKPEVVYKDFSQSKRNILDLVNAETNRKEHLALMLIANKAYVNPTTRHNIDLLRKEFIKMLSKIGYPSDIK